MATSREATEGYKLMGMGLLKEAAREFNKALGKSAQDVAALMGLARLHLARQEQELARPLLERVLQQQPEHPDARGFLARLKVEANGDPEAVKELATLASRPQAGFFDFYNLGLAMLHFRGKETVAARAFVKAIRADPRNPHAVTYLGMALLRRGDKARALKCFQRAATMAPRETLPLQLASQVLLQQGHVGQAQAQLVEALRRAPKKARLHEEFIKLCLFTGAMKPAMKSALELRLLEPKNPNGVYLHGLVMLLSGKVDEARRLFKESVEQTPKSWEAKLGLAKALQLGENPDAEAARKLLEEAVALAPAEPGPANDLAVLYLRKPQTVPQARELLGRVLAKHPEDAGTNLNMALALLSSDKKSAAQHAQKARGSTDPKVREQAERLLKQVA